MKKIKLTGNDIMFWMVWLSLAGLLIEAKFFPGMLKELPTTQPRPAPWPWWGLMVMSAPVLVIWLHFLYVEIRRIIKKHGRGWWKIKF